MAPKKVLGLGADDPPAGPGSGPGGKRKQAAGWAKAAAVEGNPRPGRATLLSTDHGRTSPQPDRQGTAAIVRRCCAAAGILLLARRPSALRPVVQTRGHGCFSALGFARWRRRRGRDLHTHPELARTMEIGDRLVTVMRLGRRTGRRLGGGTWGTLGGRRRPGSSGAWMTGGPAETVTGGPFPEEAGWARWTAPGRPV